jgi:hypothetical protein
LNVYSNFYRGLLERASKSNPGKDMETVRKDLEKSVLNKKKGTACIHCGSPIWAIGSALIGWNGCFTCITGETDNSEDYEIDSARFS